MKRILLVVIVLLMVVAGYGYSEAKSASNQPYVTTGMIDQSPFYAKCIPEKGRGSEGATQIIRLRQSGDEIITTFAWYNRGGLVLGHSPVTGKVAVMRIKQDEGLDAEKQIEFSFYMGDQLLKSYTAADLVKLGAKLELDGSAIEAGLGVDSKRAVYTVEGCKQVWNTNDYYFSVKLNETKTLCFDIVSGKLGQIEADGDRKQRFVPMEK